MSHTPMPLPDEERAKHEAQILIEVMAGFGQEHKHLQEADRTAVRKAYPDLQEYQVDFIRQRLEEQLGDGIIRVFVAPNSWHPGYFIHCSAKLSKCLEIVVDVQKEALKG